MARPSPAKEILGLLCIFSLWAVKTTPAFLLKVVAYVLLPVYLRLRKKRNQKLLQIWKKANLNISLSEYYWKRFSTALHYIKSDFYRKLVVAPKIRGWNHLESALERETKLILCGLHLGPFELQHLIPFKKLSQVIKGRKILLANPAFSLLLENYIRQKRGQGNLEMLTPGNLGKNLRGFFKKGGILALMADQCPGSGKNDVKLLNCFSLPVPLKTLKICDQNGACLIPISSYWEGEVPCVEIHPPFELNSHKKEKENANENSLEMLLTAFLEFQIKSRPLEWNWSYPKILAS